MAPNQHSIHVDTGMLLKLLGSIEWFVRTEQLTYDEALAVIHSAVDEAMANESGERSNDPPTH